MTDRRFDASWLRLVMITEGSADRERIVAAVTAAVAGGIRVVQGREERYGEWLSYV